eukprot:3137961-Rhodomonas_salina.2
MSESNASDATMPDNEDLDALAAQATRDLQDIRLAVHFAGSLDDAAQRRTFFADFYDYFHARPEVDAEQDSWEGVGRVPFGKQEGPQGPSRNAWRAPAEAVEVQSESEAVDDEEDEGVAEDDGESVDVDEGESEEMEQEAEEEGVSAEELLRELQRLDAGARQEFIAEVPPQPQTQP